MTIESLGRTPEGQQRKSYLTTGSWTNIFQSIWVRIVNCSWTNLIILFSGVRYITLALLGSKAILSNWGATLSLVQVSHRPIYSVDIPLTFSFQATLAHLHLVCKTLKIVRFLVMQTMQTLNLLTDIEVADLMRAAGVTFPWQYFLLLNILIL